MYGKGLGFSPTSLQVPMHLEDLRYAPPPYGGWHYGIIGRGWVDGMCVKGGGRSFRGSPTAPKVRLQLGTIKAD